MTADGRIRAIWVLFGGVLGVLFAWICESTGHAPWAVLLMLACSVLAIFLIPIPGNSPLRALSIWCFSQPKPTRAAFVFILIAITLIAAQSLGINPRASNYLPLLPAVIASNILFGAGFALFAVPLSLLMADYLFAAPVSDLSAPLSAQIAVFVSFGAIGAALAWILVSFLTVLSQAERDIFER
jgi:hypothetical protein